MFTNHLGKTHRWNFQLTSTIGTIYTEKSTIQQFFGNHSGGNHEWNFQVILTTKKLVLLNL